MNKIYSVESPNNYQPLVPNNYQRLEQDGAGRGETLETRFNNNIMSAKFLKCHDSLTYEKLLLQCSHP